MEDDVGDAVKSVEDVDDIEKGDDRREDQYRHYLPNWKIDWFQDINLQNLSLEKSPKL